MVVLPIVCVHYFKRHRCTFAFRGSDDAIDWISNGAGVFKTAKVTSADDGATYVTERSIPHRDVQRFFTTVSEMKRRAMLRGSPSSTRAPQETPCAV